jgi:hypothetical protein
MFFFGWLPDGFHGPGRESDALAFAKAIPTLELVGFRGKTDQSVSILWTVKYKEDVRESLDDGGDRIVVSLREVERTARRRYATTKRTGARTTIGRPSGRATAATSVAINDDEPLGPVGSALQTLLLRYHGH